MIELTRDEALFLTSQFATSKKKGSGRGRKYWPLALTEQGVAMLSSVLNSERAVQVNVAVIRTFVRLRHVLASNRDLAERLAEAEKRIGTHEAVLGEHARAIRSVFEDIRRMMGPPDGPKSKIGF